jgi:hypothetical protein
MHRGIREEGEMIFEKDCAPEHALYLMRDLRERVK